MKLKQITVPIENSPGRLYEFTRALNENGIDLKALNLVDTGNFGELRIMVSDVASARQILIQKDIPGRVDDVVAVEIEGKFGHLSHLIESLMKAGISIKYTYTVKGVSPGKSIMIFSFSDNDKAISVLSENDYPLLDFEAVDKLEHAC